MTPFMFGGGFLSLPYIDRGFGQSAFIFDALMSDDPDDLGEAARRADEAGEWPDDFREGIEGLKEFRENYRDRWDVLSDSEREVAERFDDEMTMELVRKLTTRGLLLYPPEDDKPSPSI